jgi:urease accessory protein
MRLKFKVATAAAAAGVMLSLEPALAHHAMGGELPRTAWQGLLSGLGHPVIGLDHLAFIIGVGLMSQLAGRPLLLPMLFVLGTVLGCFVHVREWSLPWPEPVIAASVALAAAIVGLRPRVPGTVLAPLFAAAGVFHGYAYGESIVGAEPAPLAAYVLGFGLIQYGIAVASGAALHRLTASTRLQEATALRIAGGGIALVAAFALLNAALLG